jgi:hypothetical protein
VATSHDTNTHGRHRADNNCLARGNGSETQIRPFYEFERRNELDGGAVAERCHRHERLSVIRREGDDAIVIFGGAGARSVQEWAQNIIHTKPQENSMRSESQSCLISKYLWFVLSRRASLLVGTDVSTKKRCGSNCSTTKRCRIGRCGPSCSTTNRCSSNCSTTKRRKSSHSVGASFGSRLGVHI